METATRAGETPFLSSINMNSVLIVGGGGFLGSHLASHVHELYPRASIRLFDIRFSPTMIAEAKHNGWECIEGTLEDEDHLVRTMTSGTIDVVFHCACAPFHLNDRYAYSSRTCIDIGLI